MTNFYHWHFWRKSALFYANYSIKHNNKVLIYGILEADMCLKVQNIICFSNLLKNKGARAISVRYVSNQKLQILRGNMICFCVIIGMYGYERVCISIYEYLLA